MNVLIGLVIATFIVTGAYIGYHVSEQHQEHGEEVKGHGTDVRLEILGDGSGLAQISQDSKPDTALSLYAFKSNLYH